MGMFSFGGDTGETQQSLARKRAIAEAMMQSQIQPRDAWSGLANAGEKIAGALMARKLDKEDKSMQDARSQTVAQALASMRGTPEWKNPDNPSEGIPARPADKAAAYSMLAGSNDPQLQDLGMKMQMQDMSSADAEKTWQSHFGMQNDAENARTKQQQQFQMQQNAANNARAMEVAKLGVDRSRFYAIPTSTGYVKMDKTTGAVQPITADEAATLPTMPGTPGQTAQPAQPYLPPSMDANAQAQVAAAKSSATAQGTAQGTAQAAMPAAEQSKDYIQSLIKGVAEDPQLPNAIGMVDSRLPTITGYNSGIRAKIDQLKGNAFLQAFQNLRGGGAITEVEGQKATDAQARLNAAQTMDEYQSALKDMNDLVEQHYAVAQQRANPTIALPGAGAAQAPRQTSGGVKWSVEP